MSLLSGTERRDAEAVIEALAVAVLLLASVLRPSLAEEAPTPRPDDVEREYEETVARLVEQREELPSDENAAHYYLKAIAALPKVADEELDEFLAITVPLASPEALKEMPTAREQVRKYGESVTQHLRRGAEMKRCAFDLDWHAGVAMQLPDYAGVRDLARRAVCYGKLLELEGKKAEAARVYLDVIRMGLHVAQDPSPIPMAVGMCVVDIGGRAIEGLLAREVDAETAGLLLDGMRNLPTPHFRPSRAMHMEHLLLTCSLREHYAEFASHGREEYLRGLKTLEEVLGMLGKTPREHKPWEVPDDPEEIARQLIEACEILDRQMRLLTRAAEGPYHEALPRVKSLARVQEGHWQGEVAEGRLAGTVGDLRMGVLRVLATAARTEARLRALKLLAAACLAKAETGKYPESLGGLKKYFPKGVPKDPFTGKDFKYWVGDGAPHLACEGDHPVIKNEWRDTYVFGPAYRLCLEKLELDKWRARRDRTPREEGGRQD